MKFMLSIFIPLISLASVQEFVSGIVRSSNSRAGRAINTITPANTCSRTNKVASYCENQGSCEEEKNIFVCNIGTSAEDLTACGTTKKYCTGEPGQQRCSDKPDPTCPYLRPEICQKPGYYPDPTNCYAYYYCYKSTADPTKILSYKVDCPVGAPFNPAGPEDRLCEIDGNCITINCTGLANGWYPLNYGNITKNQTATKCIDGVATTTYVCPAGLSVDLQSSTAKCILECLHNYQKAVYEEDDEMYYICLLNREYVRKCPIGQKFIPQILECGA